MVKARLRISGGTDSGRIRANNEDVWYADPDRGIFFVIDGMGGEAAGEKAAEIAAARLRARLERQTGTVEQRLREAIANANNEILRAASANPEWQGMACVLTAAILDNGSVVLGHVGDSRAYLLGGGKIRKITHDHSPVGEREDAHEISEIEAMRHPRRNEVFRDVGSLEHTPDDPEFIEIVREPFPHEAALLLCSDGLTDQVSSDAIRRMVESHAGDPTTAASELIDAANRAGGKDNVTVVLVEGEQFVAGPNTSAERRAHVPGRALLFGLSAALLLALAALALVLPRVLNPKVVTVELRPRVLAAGPGMAYASISAALAAARAGDTVEVAPGEYPESVRLRPGVTVRSREPREAILRAAPLNSGPAVIAENVTGARFNGFRVLGDAQAPLPAGIVLRDSEVEVQDNEIAGAGVGVEIAGSSKVALLGNVIHDCRHEGVLITGEVRPWISQNQFQNNRGAAISARSGGAPVLWGNVFDSPDFELPGISADVVREHNFILKAVPGRGGKKP
jgi:serine/threonine protein phosphatase PrpC